MKLYSCYCKKAAAFIFLACLIRSFTSATAQEEEFSYDESSDRGPSKWGRLKPEWKTCGTGIRQSPIDIPIRNAVVSPLLGDLDTFYYSRPAVVNNMEHNIAVLWKGNAGKINIYGNDYKIIQCHWHSPSEHLFGGARHALEIHIVHRNAQNKTVVVAKAYDVGKPDPFLSKLLSSIKRVGKGERKVRYLNPRKIGFFSRPYYRYMGSLTTPPCTEGVVWTVFQEVKTASIEQIEALKDALPKEFKDNSRPTQALNGRKVSFYTPHGCV